MSSGNEVNAVGLVELLHDVSAEEVAGTARRQAPALEVLGVRPHEVAHRPVVRDLLLAVDAADVVQRVDGRGEAAVDAEDALVDEGRQAEVVEDLGAVAPDVDAAVLTQALVVEAVDLRDLPALVVASDERDPVCIPHLECQQQEERLHAVESAVHEVAHEEVIGIRAVSANLEEFHQVIELAVNVAADRHWRINSLHVALLHEDLARFCAQSLDL
mmetsp:Transcript_111600/g.326405  ORF Transcript_111600/g.326405 Transcript_111600/m.326405 type:complete len:216 (-) Transcript_111600:149-796(-)